MAVFEEDKAILLMQVSKLLAEAAPEQGRVVHDLRVARQWIHGEVELTPTISSTTLRAAHPLVDLDT